MAKGVPSNRTVRTPMRKGLFWAWVVASALVGLYIAIAGPFAHYFGEGRSYVALATPGLMFFMLATGLGWLVLFVLAGPPRRTEKHAREDRQTPAR